MSVSLPRLPFGKPTFRLPSGGSSLRNRLNGTGAAGPRRILAFAGVGVALGAAVAGLTLRETTHPPVSRPGRLPQADPLPGGPNSNPYQDALAMRSNHEAAAQQQEAGQSYTPQIAPSQPYADKPRRVRALLTSPPPPPPPAAKTVEASPPAPVPRPKWCISRPSRGKAKARPNKARAKPRRTPATRPPSTA